ncbi:hypothetical protein BKA69DRAFT_1091544 [Paraphysoderma sedebokerense]|nr:hypothetical protein BKA69DRAFT_1091544 [Paraphysoderma sedebokerense]
MSVCTIRSGLWPYGDDISQYNIRSYTRQLPLYQAVFNRLRTVQIQTWQGNNEFSNTCKQLMSQCVAATGLTTDTVIGVCGNLMSICTFENPNWPTSDDGNPAYLEPYEDRWFRYASALSASSFNFSANRWQEVNRFSSHCRKIFFQCVENSGGRFRDDSVGICGHRLSICTFEDNIWPTSNDAQANLLLEPYQTRLPLYRMQFQHLRNGSNSLRWYPRIIPEYFYIRHISGSCVRPQSDTTVPATTAPIVLHKGCNDESFSFQFTSNGSLMHKASGKCLHPSGKLLIPTNGTSMIIADGCDEPRVQFNYSMDGYLRHKESGRCLNGQGGSLQPVDNTPLVLSDPCSSHHEFSLIPIPTSDPIYISACETHVALLSCPMGQRIANALMQYGRWDNGLCPHVTVSSNTRPQFATRQLNDANGKQSASVIVSNESFGSDVYPSVYKHGLISYSCDPA